MIFVRTRADGLQKACCVSKATLQLQNVYILLYIIPLSSKVILSSEGYKLIMSARARTQTYFHAFTSREYIYRPMWLCACCTSNRSLLTYHKLYFLSAIPRRASCGITRELGSLCTLVRAPNYHGQDVIWPISDENNSTLIPIILSRFLP